MLGDFIDGDIRELAALAVCRLSCLSLHAPSFIPRKRNGVRVDDRRGFVIEAFPNGVNMCVTMLRGRRSRLVVP
jgi:hypothetical protein